MLPRATVEVRLCGAIKARRRPVQLNCIQFSEFIYIAEKATATHMVG